MPNSRAGEGYGKSNGSEEAVTTSHRLQRRIRPLPTITSRTCAYPLRPVSGQWLSGQLQPKPRGGQDSGAGYNRTQGSQGAQGNGSTFNRPGGQNNAAGFNRQGIQGNDRPTIARQIRAMDPVSTDKGSQGKGKGSQGKQNSERPRAMRPAPNIR